MKFDLDEGFLNLYSKVFYGHSDSVLVHVHMRTSATSMFSTCSTYWATVGRKVVNLDVITN